MKDESERSFLIHPSSFILHPSASSPLGGGGGFLLRQGDGLQQALDDLIRADALGARR